MLIRCKRTDNRHAQAVPKSSVHCSAEENLRFVVNVPAKLLHDDFDFGQGHTRPARHLNENPRDIRQRATSIHQRTLERLREGIVRAIVRLGFAIAKQASAIPAAQCRKQIVEANADETWSLNKIHNTPEALTDGVL